MRERPIVGQKLIAYETNRKSYCTVVVSKVGRKYFEVTKQDYSWWKVKFHLDNWKEDTNYTPTVYLYSDRGELRDEITHKLALQTLWQYFDSLGGTQATTAQLMQACAALELTEAVREKVSDKLGEFLDDKNL